MTIDKGWAPRSPRETKNVISADNRKYIISETKINKNNLTKYLNILKRKGLLTKLETGGYEVSKNVMPVVERNKVEINFILDLNGE